MRFVGKRAMVTGAGHGIGLAIAQRLAEEGAQVLICDRHEARAEAAANSIGHDVAAHVIDVRERCAVEGAVAKAVALWDGLDVLVANAGVMDRMPFLETTDEHWRTVLGINLYGAFLCGQLAARRMVAQGTGGRIVNVASNSGIFGGRGRAAYGTSKAGLINLTQCMAIELAEHDILVNAVAPGPTKTHPELQGELMASAAQRMPLKRFGHPSEIAAVAAFLASDDCTFTTGHTYAADGGFTVAGVMEG